VSNPVAATNEVIFKFDVADDDDDDDVTFNVVELLTSALSKVSLRLIHIFSKTPADSTSYLWNIS
jgi:hypothetical protein